MHPRELFTDVRTEVVAHNDYHGAPAEVVSNSRLSVFRRNPQEYFQRFITKEIEDEEKKDCLVFGQVFHEAVLEPKSQITRDNAMEETLGVFRVCGMPLREPDIETKHEKIWFQDLPEPGIVRSSTTWGELSKDRTWLLSPDRSVAERAGYCAFADLIKEGDHFRTIREEYLSSSGSRVGAEWKAFKASVPASMALYKPKEWFNLVAMRRELRAHPLARQILFGEANENRHTEFTIRGVDRETGIRVQTKLDFCQKFDDGVLVVDLKSSRDASPSCWRRQAEKDGLHVQAAFQIGLASLLFDMDVEFRFCVVQKDAPYRVEVYEMQEEFIEIGVEDYLRDIRKFAACNASGIWQPAKYGEVQMLETPSYRMLDRQLAWRSPDGALGFSDDGYTEE
jgi:hypothetical protein